MEVYNVFMNIAHMSKNFKVVTVALSSRHHVTGPTDAGLLVLVHVTTVNEFGKIFVNVQVNSSYMIKALRQVN